MPTIYVINMMTIGRMLPALGKSQTMRAISQPAKAALSKVVPNAPSTECTEMSAKALFTAGSNTSLYASTALMAHVAAMLAASTSAQSRITRSKVVAVRLCRRGRIGVSVFSVKSCWRPSTTIKNPAVYPNLVRSSRQGASGRRD